MIPMYRVAPSLTKEVLEDLYVKQGLSCGVIASRFGLSRTSVKMRLRKHGIPLRPPSQRYANRKGKGRHAIDLTDQRFGLLIAVERVANDARGRTRWRCVCDCGNEHTVSATCLRGGSTRSCGCLQRRFGPDNPAWEGGFVNRQGYRVFKVNGKRMVEHRYVMEQVLGRPLLPSENVHHRNGIRHDNRPENLELWVKSQPCGQRVPDIVAHAEEMLRRYAPERLRE